MFTSGSGERLMSEDSNKKLNFIVKVAYIALIVALVFVGLRVVGLVFPFIIALILVAIFQPIIRLIHNKLRLNQKAVSIIILILLYALLAFIIFWLVLRVVFLLKDFFTSVPNYYKITIEPALNILADWLQNMTVDAPESLGTAISTMESSILGWLSEAVINISKSGASIFTSFLSALPAFFVSLVFTILLSFFISIQYDSVINFFKLQLGAEKVDFVANVITLAKRAITRYLRAVVILMSITFVELSIGFLILRVSNPLLIALAVAIFDAFPVLGTGGILIPWTIIELIQQNFGMALGLGILQIVITIVRQSIEPRVVGKQLGINPIVSLVAIYLGYRLLGVQGMILFPILIQIILVLQENNSIRIFKTKNDSETAQPDEPIPSEPDK